MEPVKIFVTQTDTTGKGQIPLRYPARELVTSCEPVCDQVRAFSTCLDSSHLSAIGRKPRLRPAREMVCDQFASWIAG